MHLPDKACWHNGMKRWRVTWRDRNRRQHSRFFKSREAAKAFVAEATGEIAELGGRWRDLPMGVRAELIGALDRSIRGGYTLSDACSYYERHATAPPPPSKEVKELVTAFLVERRKEQAAGDLRPRTLASYESRLEKFADAFGNVPARSITSREITDFLSLNPEWSARTRKGIRIDLHAFFGWCVRHEHLKENPVAKVPIPRVADITPPILTPAEAENLMRSAERIDPGLIAYLGLSLFAGLRPESEIRRLAAEDIRLDVGMIHIHGGSTKTRRRRLVTLQGNLKSWLERWIPLGQPIVPKNFKRRWERVRDAAGFGPPRGWPQDVARHSFCSYAYLLLGEDRAAQEAGHSVAELHRSYRNLATLDQAKAWFSIIPAQESDYAAVLHDLDRRAQAKRRATPERMRAMAAARHAKSRLPDRLN